MRDSRFEVLVRYRNDKIRTAKYCDFDREKWISRFESLPLASQKILIREELNRVRRQRSLAQRLEDYKDRKIWLDFFTKESV
jgi:hypothetical protein